MANFREFLEKNTIFNEHPVVYLEIIINIVIAMVIDLEFEFIKT